MDSDDNDEDSEEDDGAPGLLNISYDGDTEANSDEDDEEGDSAPELVYISHDEDTDSEEESMDYDTYESIDPEHVIKEIPRNEIEQSATWEMQEL